MRRASRTALARTASSVWLPIRMTRRTPNEPRKAGQTAGSKYSQLLPPLFSCCCTSGFAPKNKKARRTRRSRLAIVPDVVNMSPPTKKKGAAPSISVVLMGLRTASCPTTRSCTSRDRKNNNATSRPPTLMCTAAAAAAAAAAPTATRQNLDPPYRTSCIPADPTFNFATYPDCHRRLNGQKSRLRWDLKYAPDTLLLDLVHSARTSRVPTRPHEQEIYPGRGQKMASATAPLHTPLLRRPIASAGSPQHQYLGSQRLDRTVSWDPGTPQLFANINRYFKPSHNLKWVPCSSCFLTIRTVYRGD